MHSFRCSTEVGYLPAVSQAGPHPGTKEQQRTSEGSRGAVWGQGETEAGTHDRAGTSVLYSGWGDGKSEGMRGIGGDAHFGWPGKASLLRQYVSRNLNARKEQALWMVLENSI